MIVYYIILYYGYASYLGCLLLLLEVRLRQKMSRPSNIPVNQAKNTNKYKQTNKKQQQKLFSVQTVTTKQSFLSLHLPAKKDTSKI